ncbi:hypothetical protein ES703_107599 [subsurface metagenome]
MGNANLKRPIYPSVAVGIILSLIKHTSKLVPPISIVIILDSPVSSEKNKPAKGPEDGPDRASLIGILLTVLIEVTPELDCIMSNSFSYPFCLS